MTAIALDVQRAMHAGGGYGGWAGQAWLPDIVALARATGCRSALDWGCGQGGQRAALAAALGVPVTLWDPAVPKLDALPAFAAFDLVLCTDVLEHLPAEDAAADAVADLVSRAERALFVTVCCRPANQVLPDGRNAHTLLRPFTWWRSLFARTVSAMAARVVLDLRESP